MLESSLEQFFARVAPMGRDDGLVIAFSGGPDSTALLRASARVGRRHGWRVTAAHLDHGLDATSAERAARAAELADALGITLRSRRADPVAEAKRPRGLEDWARRVRYQFLEDCRREVGAAYIATAHHRQDQVETVLLRILLGSGLAGLAAIEPRRGHVVRPLLEVEPAVLAASLEGSGLIPVDDPSNRELGRPRNLLRRRLLPRLEADAPNLADRAVGIAEATQRFLQAVGPRLSELLNVDSEVDTASLELRGFRRLSPPLRQMALARLHRELGLPYPAASAPRLELDRQLAGGGEIGCDCGAGWYWTDSEGRLVLRRREASPAPFAYTLRVPGAVTIPELGMRVSVGREPVEGWAFRGHPERAALDLPIGPGASLTVRNRLPGDRIRPLGFGHEKRLKDVLIDKGIPRTDRDRLPILCWNGHIVWVPGVTIDDAYRIADQTSAWVARLESI